MVESSLGSRDKTLGPMLDPAELLGPPGGGLVWSISQLDTL